MTKPRNFVAEMAAIWDGAPNPDWKPATKPTDTGARELADEKNKDDARSRDPEDVV